MTRNGQHDDAAERGAQNRSRAADAVHPAYARGANFRLVIGGRIGLKAILRSINTHSAEENQYRQRHGAEINHSLR